MSNNTNDPSRRITLLHRIWLAPACPRYDVLSKCSDNSFSMLCMLAALQWGAAIWTCVLIATAFKIITAYQDQWEWHHIALAILVTAVIAVADACVFIASAYHAHGIARLEATGDYSPPRTRAAKIRSTILVASRFAMAMVLVNFLALVACLAALHKDLKAALLDEYHRANAGLTVRAAEQFDTELRKLGLQIDGLNTVVADGHREHRRLTGIIVEPTADDPELRSALERLRRAEADKAEADRALLEAESASADEVDGTCRHNRSCRPGKGPRWRANQERILAARRRQIEAAQAIASAQTRVAALQESRADELRRKVADAKARQSENSATIQTNEAKLAAVNVDYQSRITNREGLIRKAVESNPQYVPLQDGLIARIKALRHLMEQPAVAAFVYLIEAALLFLELAAVVGVTISTVPIEYVTELARNNVLRDHVAARSLVEALRRDSGANPIGLTAIVAPPISAQATPASSGAGAAPARNGSARHAPRWKPTPPSSWGDPSGGNTPPP